MTTRTTTSFSAVWLFLLLAGGLQRQELPRATAQYGAFAFADLSGTRLLAASTLPQPEMLHAALCSDGRRFPVQFEKRQIEREDNNGRQTAYNFDKLAGNVFTVLQGKISEDASCFLASAPLLASATVLPAEPPAKSSECGPDVQRRIASSRSRRVVNCWPIARLPSDRRLVLAEFARQDKDTLASLVLVDGDRMIFSDHHAVFRGEGQDLWRADDGGALSPDFEVVCVLQRGDWYALGISWAGAEGLSLSLWISEGGERFTEVLSDYWYRAPL